MSLRSMTFGSPSTDDVFFLHTVLIRVRPAARSLGSASPWRSSSESRARGSDAACREDAKVGGSRQFGSMCDWTLYIRRGVRRKECVCFWLHGFEGGKRSFSRLALGNSDSCLTQKYLQPHSVGDRDPGCNGL